MQECFLFLFQALDKSERNNKVDSAGGVTKSQSLRASKPLAIIPVAGAALISAADLKMIKKKEPQTEVSMCHSDKVSFSISAFNKM